MGLSKADGWHFVGSFAAIPFIKGISMTPYRKEFKYVPI